MSQVRKYQSGGGLGDQNELLIDIGGIKYLKSDVVKLFKNQSLRDSYSKDFIGNDSELDQLFNQIADIYAEGLNSGKMRFDSDGKHILDPSGQYYNIDKIIEKPKTTQDYFNNLSVRVMNMFEMAKSRGYIQSWDSKVKNKTPYEFNETRLLTTNYFHKPEEYDWDNLSPAWFALDKMDESTGVRPHTNRKNALINAILEEAYKIDTDESYRQKFSFEGELTNPYAYKEYTKAMRDYAEKLKSLNDYDESLLQVGTVLGTNPRLLYAVDSSDTSALFSPASDQDLAIAERNKQLEKQKQDEAKAAEDAAAAEAATKLKEDLAANGILRNFDPLSTEDVLIFDNNKFLQLSDNLNGISGFGLSIAAYLQDRYAREQIKSDWYSWNKKEFIGKYLENLTNYFSLKSGYKVYAMTNGPISHKGKRFFVKKPSDRYPTEVKLRKIGVDYYAYDKSGKELAKLGMYSYDKDKSIITTDADLKNNLGLIIPTALSKDEDTGERIPFATALAFSSIDAMNNYWNTLGTIDITTLDPRRFEDILKGVSMQFLSLPKQDQYKYNAFNTDSNPKSWYGTRFALYENEAGKVIFSWIKGNKELAFESNVSRDEFIKKYLKKLGNIQFIDYGFIKAVHKRIFSGGYDIIGYKLGGKLNKYSVGGSIFDTQASQVKLGLIKQQKPVDAPLPILTIQEPLSEQPEQSKELLKLPEELTVADGVRLGASILDLTGAFMLFPKGLNVASAAVSAASLVGYIGADIADILEGKKELWPTLKKDAEIAGVQAIALVNPVKAGQIAPALAKIVPMIPHIAGVLWTYDILSDDNSRKAIMNTFTKLLQGRVSDINSLDLTNLAFVARTLIGAKMGLSSLKRKATGKVKQLKNRTQDEATVHYKVEIPSAESTGTYKTNSILIKRGIGKSKASNKVEDLKLRIVEEYNRSVKEGEPTIKKENVTILDKENGNPVTSKTVELQFKETNDILAESWAPGRLFERATQHGSLKDGHVTRESTWLGKQIRAALGEDFDVWFSDEALMRNKWENQVKNLATNLYGGIEGIKSLAQIINKVLNSAKYKNAALSEREAMMQNILEKAGYLYKPKTSEAPVYEGAVNKANEIVEVANLLNSMTPYEAAERLVGIDSSKATEWKGNAPENTVTSEMLRSAYNLFKQLYNTEAGYVPQFGDLQELTEYMARTLKGEVKEGGWKPTESLNEILNKTYEKVINRGSENNPQIRELFQAITNPAQLRTFILNLSRQLLLSGKLSKADFLLILNALNLTRNANKFTSTTEETPVNNESPAVESNETNVAESTPILQEVIREQEQSPSELEAKKLIERERLLENLLFEYLTPEELNRLKGRTPEEVDRYLEFRRFNDDVKRTVHEYLSIPEHAVVSPKLLESKASAKELEPQIKQTRRERRELNKELATLKGQITDLKELLNKVEISGKRKRKLVDKDLAQLEDAYNLRISELEEEFENLRASGAPEEDFQANAEAVLAITEARNETASKKTQLLENLREKYKALKKDIENLETKRTEVQQKSEAANAKYQEVKTKYNEELKKINEIENSTASNREKRSKFIASLHRLKATEKALISDLNDPKITLDVRDLVLQTLQKTTKKIDMLEKRIKKLSIPKNMLGGSLDFAISVFSNRPLKLLQGGYLPVGKKYIAAIQPNFDDPYNTGWSKYINSWFKSIGSEQLEGMLALLNLNEGDWLGDNGFVYKQNQLKYGFDTKWSGDYHTNNGAYFNPTVGDYLIAVGNLDPIKQAVAKAYSNGRYRLKSDEASSGVFEGNKDNLYSAITHDMSLFGNINWLTEEDKQNYLKQLKASVGDKYNFAVDKNGYIYPIANDSTELADGHSLFYSNDTVDADGKLISESSSKTAGRSGSSDDGDIKPIDVPNPRINKNWLDILTLAASLTGTIDSANQIKFRPTLKTTYNAHDRITTGNNAQRVTLAYAELFNNAPTSSDSRYNSAIRLNLGVNYVKLLLDAFEKDRTEFYTSLTKAQQTALNNLDRHYKTYNENLTDYIAQQKYKDTIKYQEKLKLWQNLVNYLATKSTDIENANKVRLAKHWQTYSDKIEKLRLQRINEIKLQYWNLLSEEEKRNKYLNSITTYLTSPEFRSTYGDEYDRKINKINKLSDDNINNLIDGLYSIYPKDITYLTTYGSTFKNGGQIQMAKNGSNLNWAKIENARMVNKSINESIKETYKSIRSANRELQKTIRALAPMMKALNTYPVK